MKKTTCIFLTLILLLSAFSFAAHAETEDITQSYVNGVFYFDRVGTTDLAYKAMSGAILRYTANKWNSNGNSTIEAGDNGYGLRFTATGENNDWGITITTPVGQQVAYVAIRYKTSTAGVTMQTRGQADYNGAYSEHDNLICDGKWHLSVAEVQKNTANIVNQFMKLDLRMPNGSIDIDFIGYYNDPAAAEVENARRAQATGAYEEETNQSAISQVSNITQSYVNGVFYFDRLDTTDLAYKAMSGAILRYTANKWNSNGNSIIEAGDNGYGLHFVANGENADWGITITTPVGQRVAYVAIRYKTTTAGITMQTRGQADYNGAYSEHDNLISDGEWHLSVAEVQKNTANIVNQYMKLDLRMKTGSIDIDFIGYYNDPAAAEAENMKRAIATGAAVGFDGVQSSVADGSAMIRFIGTVDLIDGTYEEFGFVLNALSKEYVTKTSKVYTSILADGEPVTAEEEGVNYLFTYVVSGMDVTEMTGNVSFSVTPYAVIDGNRIIGTTYHFAYNPSTDTFAAIG